MQLAKTSSQLSVHKAGQGCISFMYVVANLGPLWVAHWWYLFYFKFLHELYYIGLGL